MEGVSNNHNTLKRNILVNKVRQTRLLSGHDYGYHLDTLTLAIFGVRACRRLSLSVFS
jgi:hypothetical protein